MTLKQELANFLASIRQTVPAQVFETIDRGTAELRASGITGKVIKVGERAPSFVLPNASRRSVALEELLARGPVVVSFYRGGWCPFCNIELRALQRALPEIKALGATIVAISPETPDNSLATKEKERLEFEVLSDAGNAIGRHFGLVFEQPEETRAVQRGFGVDLPTRNGDGKWELPLPGTFVVDRSGRITLAWVDPDYMNRLDPSEIIAALRTLAKAA